MSDLPPLPPGFTIDAPAQAAMPPLPPGFKLDGAAAQPAQPTPAQVPPLPPGFQLDKQTQTAPPQMPQQAQAPKPTLNEYIQQQPMGVEKLGAEMMTGTLPGGNFNPVNWLSSVLPAAAHAPALGTALDASGQLTKNLIGRVSPGAGLQVQRGMQQAYGDPGGVSGFAGRAAGGLSNVPYYTNPAGWAAMALGASGQEAINQEEQKQAGNPVSYGAAKQAGAGAVDFAINAATAGMGKKLFGALAPEAATTASALLGQYVKKFGKDAVTNEVITHVGIAAHNLATGRPLTEGMGVRSIADALGATAANLGVHEATSAAKQKPTFVSRMRELQAGPSKPASQPPAQSVQQPQDSASPNQQAPAPQVTPENFPVHAPDIRPESATTEAAAKNIPPAAPQATIATPEGSKVDAAAPMPEKGQPQPQGASPHPDRFDDVQKLTDWYQSNHPEEKTADVIKAMTPDMPHVKAKVPVDFAQGVGEDVDRAKVDQLKGLSQDERDKLPPAIIGPNGDIIDGGHRIAAAKEAGASHVQAYVPESLIGQHGIEAAGEAKPQIDQEKDDHARLLETNKAVEAHKANLLEQLKQKAADKTPTQAGPVKTFLNRTVKPKIAALHEAVKASWDAVNRALGTGASWALKDRDSANRISKNLAEHEQGLRQLETTLAPHRETFKGMNDKEKTEWADQVEATGESTRPDLQEAADLNRKLNEDNIEEGKAVGLNTKKWEGDYLGRLAKFTEKAGAGIRRTIAGSQNFLKGRVFNSYSEFKKFVEEHGGEMVHDNPMDTLLAKQAEIRRSIMARKTMRGEEGRGQLKWVKDGEHDEDFGKKLNDPLAREDRPVVAPKWMVGKLSKLTHFDAQEYMKSAQWKANARPLRPGDEMPEGFTHTGQSESGTYHGDSNVADQFNNLISPGLKGNIPVLHQLASFVKGSVNLALNLSGAHYLYNGYRSFSGAVGRAASNVVNREWGLLTQNLRLANPIAAMRYGAKGLEEYRNPGSHPEMASQVKGAVEGGAKPKMASVLDRNHFEQMKKEWDAGNPIASLGHLVAGVNHAISIPLHEHFTPKIKFAAQMMHAAAHEARGLKGEELQRQQSKATDLTDNLLGQVNRDRQFQNKIVSDTMDLLLTAPKFFEGDVREVGAAARDTIQSLKDIKAGKKGVKMTPAMYSMVGHAITQVTLATMAQAAMTMMHSGGKPTMPTSLQDLIKPKTGRKDEHGNDERMYIPTPIGAIVGAASNPAAVLMNRLATPWRVLKGEVRGADEHNVELKGVGDRLRFAVRGMSPYPIQDATDTERPGKPGGWAKTAATFAGIHTSYTPGTDAEKAAYEAMTARRGEKITPRADAEKSDAEGRLADEVRDKNPAAQKDIAAAIAAGKITSKDAGGIFKRANEPTGLPGLLKSSELDARDIMDKVWPKMSAPERNDNQWLVRGKIGRANMSPADKQAYWNQIKKDVQGVK